MSFPFTVPLQPDEVISVTAAQKCPLGTRGQTADGRVFRYAQAGATALKRGYLVQSAIATTQWENATFAPWATGMLADLGTTYIPAGTTYAHLTATGDSNMTIAKDFFKEGYIWVSGTATAGGQLMKIKTHTAASSGSSGEAKNYTTGGRFIVEFEAGYAFTDNVDTGAEVSMQQNPYDALVVATVGSCDAAIVGVPPVYVPATYYFWLQTWGICPVQLDESQTEALTNKMLVNSSSTAGTVCAATAAAVWVSCGTYLYNQISIGIGAGSSAIAAWEANTYNLAHLTLAP